MTQQANSSAEVSWYLAVFVHVTHISFSVDWLQSLLCIIQS